MKKAKQAIYLLLYIILPLIATAYNGGKQTTFNNSVEFKELENKANYEYLKDNYDSNKQYNEAFIVCSNKNRYYMPTKSGADADGCYDVVGYLESLNAVGQPVTYAGYRSMSNSQTIRMSGSRYWGHGISADYICNQYYTGSRAMRASDIKYLEKTNSVPSLTNIMVLDDMVGAVEYNNDRYYANGYIGNIETTNTASNIIAINNCGPNTTYGLHVAHVSANGGGIVPLHGTVNNNDITPGTTCSTASKIVCVRD